ncbi:MAG: hypothetical protein INR70_42745 [Parafilimonas terrae]|nr:hypothetical protein [Parafilimonas terrae]
MVVSPQAGRSLRRVLTAAVLAAAGPALAQTPTAPAPAAGRSISATGRTMPPSRRASPGTPTAQGPNADAMQKAQKENEARSKAWDSKMHKTMGTICNGC